MESSDAEFEQRREEWDHAGPGPSVGRWIGVWLWPLAGAPAPTGPPQPQLTKTWRRRSSAIDDASEQVIDPYWNRCSFHSEFHRNVLAYLDWYPPGPRRNGGCCCPERPSCCPLPGCQTRAAARRNCSTGCRVGPRRYPSCRMGYLLCSESCHRRRRATSMRVRFRRQLNLQRRHHQLPHRLHHPLSLLHHHPRQMPTRPVLPSV